MNPMEMSADFCREKSLKEGNLKREVWDELSPRRRNAESRHKGRGLLLATFLITAANSTVL